MSRSIKCFDLILFFFQKRGGERIATQRAAGKARPSLSSIESDGIDGASAQETNQRGSNDYRRFES